MGEDEIIPNADNMVLYVCSPNEQGENVYTKIGTVKEATTKLCEETPPAPTYARPHSISMSYSITLKRVFSIADKDLLQLAFSRHKAKRAKMTKRIICKYELLLDLMEWVKLGWGYKPKLNPAARKPHRAKPYWHRTRSFCVRRSYH